VLHVELPGADLLVRRRVGTPTVTLGVYRVRPAPDRASQAGLGTLVARSAIRGAGALSAVDLADAFERLGGSITPSIRSGWLGFESSVLVEHLAAAASLLELVLRAPTHADEAIAIERSLLADDALQAADDMFRFPVQLAFHAAFGDSGYGLPLLGSRETVSALTADDVRRWHRDLLGAGRTTVIAVGDMEPDAAADQLAGCLAGYAAAPAIEFAAAVAGDRSASPRLEALEREKAQSAMAMLFPGPDRRAPDRHAVDLWSTIAGGLGGRLFEALRDRRSLAYTVAAFPWQHRQAGAVLTYIAMAPDREEEARAAMLAELATFRSVAPSEDEVRQSVNYVTGLKEVARQSAGALVSEILDAWLEGTGLAELADPGAPYRAVTAEAIRAAAERYLDPDRRVEGVVRGTTGRRG
jgi:zinc protease